MLECESYEKLIFTSRNIAGTRALSERFSVTTTNISKHRNKKIRELRRQEMDLKEVIKGYEKSNIKKITVSS